MTATPGLWCTIIACGLVTYGIRLSFIAVHGRVTLPNWFTRALSFVPVAVLSAIILPEVLVTNDAITLSLGNARIWAGLLATVVAWRTKNVWLTIGAGMGALFVIEIFGGRVT
jgi:branched-subunit amino acid transport protein